MNETQYYSATVTQWTDAKPKVLGYFDGDRFEIIGGVTHNGVECYRIKRSDITDLTPVRFVPQDAVVIEDGDVGIKGANGFSAVEILRTASEVAKNAGYHGVSKRLLELLSQLTPVSSNITISLELDHEQIEELKIVHGMGVSGNRIDEEIGNMAYEAVVAITQLTPPKPRPVEPKGFGAVIEAKVVINYVYPAWIPPNPMPAKRTNYSKPIRWIRNPATGKWSSEPCDDLKSSYTRDYSDLIDPVILDEGR